MSSEPDPLAECVLTPAELLAALAEHERRAAMLALAVRRLEASGEWAADSSVSVTAWLREHGRLSNREAARLVRRGRFLDRFATIADAASRRELSAGQVEALQASCAPRLEVVMMAQQTELVQILAPLSVADTETACAVWRQRAEAVIDDEAPPAEPERSLSIARAADRSLVGRFVLDEGGAGELEMAIRNASTWEGSADVRSHGRRNADALIDIAAFYNKNHEKPGTPRNHPHVELSVAAATLDRRPEAFDGDGRLMHHAAADAYLCDCVIHRIVRDAENLPTGYGRGRYTVPRHLFRQVASRDGGCRFPGCIRPVRHCDAHHIRYWRRMGLTELENLVLLCSRHHHLVHQLDLDLKLLPNGELHVTWRDGTYRTSAPRGRPLLRGP